MTCRTISILLFLLLTLGAVQPVEATATSIAPAAPVTRLELAQILSQALNLPPAAAPAPFIDLPPAGPDSAAIGKVHEAGLMHGFPGSLFSPGQKVTRAQAVAVLITAAGQISSGPAARANPAKERSLALFPFTDVPARHWAHAAISRAWQQGLVAGPQADRFFPDQPVTGWELAQLLHRFLGPEACTRAGLIHLVHKDPPPKPGHQARQVPVLLYHHLAPAGSGFDTNYATITPEEFAWQMQYLADNGYRVLDAAELTAFLRGELSAPKRSVAITFDDGYASNLKYAFPILKQHKFHAILHIISGTVPDQPQQPYDPTRLQSLSWPELQQLAASGLITIASHTHNQHIYVPQAAGGSDRPALVARITDPNTGRPETETAHYRRILTDLTTSRQQLEEKIKQPVTILAYPYGISDQAAHRAAAEAGFTLTFSTRAAPAPRKSGTTNVPRLVVPPGLTPEDFHRLLTQ
ncbi:MAG: polysaccharide deacetylase family protein [Firmicutes bacterium]|nr:polysaccharide deacetylase family protein [Bacillota bacterium]